MGHCLQYLLLIYCLLCYHGNTFVEQTSLINLVLKNVVKPLYFYFYGKTDMKYEISTSELTIPPNFTLIPLKIKKLDFVPKKRMTITVNQ